MVLNVLIILFSLESLGYCAVNYHSQKPLNKVEEGSSVTIYCYFNGNKPTGTSTWAVNNQIVAYDCHVHTAGRGILTPTADCLPDNGDGTANYSFIINNISLDQSSWMCQNLQIYEILHIPIAVRGKGTPNTYLKKNHYRSDEHLNITAHIDCSYLSGQVHWCLDDGSEVKCSDQTQWYVDVFLFKPTINQITRKCTNYETPYVLQYWSTIEGNLAVSRTGYDAKYNLYYSLNGNDYKENAIHISIKGTCWDNLIIRTIILEIANILILSVTWILTKKVKSKGLTESQMDGLKHACFVLWFGDILLILLSFLLCIWIFVTCTGWLWAFSGWLIVLALSILYFFTTKTLATLR